MSNIENKEQNPFAISNSNEGHKRVISRYRKENIFRILGKSAIVVSLSFLTFLIVNIFISGTPAFFQTQIKIPVQFGSAALVEQVKEISDEPDYEKIVKESLKAHFPDIESRKDKISLYRMVANCAAYEIQAFVRKNKGLTEKQSDMWITASSDVDMYVKNKEAGDGKLNKKQVELVDRLIKEDRLETGFNWRFFAIGDSREPEQAGILGAFIGSFMTIIVCMLVSFPIAVFAAIYLEEFAPKNKFTDILEVSVNNLAAVPSIVYGLLGLAVFLNIFGMPRSSSLVGGVTLAMLILPIIIIATRNSLKSVPPSVKDAASALGASPMQVLFHHTLPLAMPGIMTGTIIGIARAIGETAPLLMIGMVAFIVDVPTTVTDSATSLTVQIYLWADSPEAGFAQKTSAAIMVLLFFLGAMNLLAVYLRKKFEHKW